MVIKGECNNWNQPALKEAYFGNCRAVVTINKSDSPLVFILFTASTTHGPVFCRARYLQQRSQAVWHDRFIAWIGWTWVQFLNKYSLIHERYEMFWFEIITCRESNSSDDKSVGRFFIWSSKSSIIRSFLLRKRAVIIILFCLHLKNKFLKIFSKKI